MAKRIVPFAVIAVALAGLLLWSQQRPALQKVSGVIESDEIRLGSRVGGRVKAVFVEEGDAVSKGEPLVELEPYDLQERLAEANAALSQRRREWEKMKDGFREEEKLQAKARYERFVAMVDRMEREALPAEVQAAKAKVSLAQAQLERAQQSERQLQEVFARQPDAAPEETRNRAREEVLVAQANLKVREEELEILLIGAREEERREARAQRDEAKAAWDLAVDGFREEDVDIAKAAFEAAQADVGMLQEQIAELTIRSSVDGLVEAMELQPGDLVSPSAPVISVIDSNRLWVRAYVPQGALAIQIGQKLKVTVDAYPNRTFDGEVTFVGRQAEFTPSNVQTYEERAKQMFRMKVTLLPVEDENVQLRPGMTADVWLK